MRPRTTNCFIRVLGLRGSPTAGSQVHHPDDGIRRIASGPRTPALRPNSELEAFQVGALNAFQSPADKTPARPWATPQDRQLPLDRPNSNDARGGCRPNPRSVKPIPAKHTRPPNFGVRPAQTRPVFWGSMAALLERPSKAQPEDCGKVARRAPPAITPNDLGDLRNPPRVPDNYPRRSR